MKQQKAEAQVHGSPQSEKSKRQVYHKDEDQKVHGHEDSTQNEQDEEELKHLEETLVGIVTKRGIAKTC